MLHIQYTRICLQSLYPGSKEQRNINLERAHIGYVCTVVPDAAEIGACKKQCLFRKQEENHRSSSVRTDRVDGVSIISNEGC